METDIGKPRSGAAHDQVEGLASHLEQLQMEESRRAVGIAQRQLIWGVRGKTYPLYEDKRGKLKVWGIDHVTDIVWCSPVNSAELLLCSLWPWSWSCPSPCTWLLPLCPSSMNVLQTLTATNPHHVGWKTKRSTQLWDDFHLVEKKKKSLSRKCYKLINFVPKQSWCSSNIPPYKDVFSCE